MENFWVVKTFLDVNLKKAKNRKPCGIVTIILFVKALNARNIVINGIIKELMWRDRSHAFFVRNKYAREVVYKRTFEWYNVGKRRKVRGDNVVFFNS